MPLRTLILHLFSFIAVLSTVVATTDCSFAATTENAVASPLIEYEAPQTRTLLLYRPFRIYYSRWDPDHMLWIHYKYELPKAARLDDPLARS